MSTAQLQFRPTNHVQFQWTSAFGSLLKLFYVNTRRSAISEILKSAHVTPTNMQWSRSNSSFIFNQIFNMNINKALDMNVI